MSMRVNLYEKGAERIIKWKLCSCLGINILLLIVSRKSFLKSRFSNPMTQHKLLIQCRKPLITIIRVREGVRDRVSAEERTRCGEAWQRYRNSTYPEALP